MSNPFSIGDTVIVKNPDTVSPGFRSPLVIKDIDKDNIRFDRAWWHCSHFRLVKEGLLSRVGQDREFVRTASIKEMKDAGLIPESHPAAGRKDTEFVRDCLNEFDPKGLPAAVPGAKNDAGKVEAGLLLDFGLALREVARVCTFGASKYSRQGWLHVDEGIRRYRDAGIRHQLAGNLEEKDEESSLLHLAHQAWNVLAELELRLRACENKK